MLRENGRDTLTAENKLKLIADGDTGDSIKQFSVLISCITVYYKDQYIVQTVYSQDVVWHCDMESDDAADFGKGHFD